MNHISHQSALIIIQRSRCPPQTITIMRLIYVAALFGMISHTHAFAPSSRWPIFTHQHTGADEDSTSRHHHHHHHHRHSRALAPPTFGRRPALGRRRRQHYATLQPVSADMEGIPIPFIDRKTNTFIDCYADCFCVLNGITYTIGVPCDTAVSLCRMGAGGQLVPLTEESEIDKVFSIAASAIQDEFDEELVLQRTPQTLTLVGELEDDEDEDDEAEDDEDEDDEDLQHADGGDEDGEDGDESVELLLSFEHEETEYALVRMLDPVLLVGVLEEGAEPQLDKRYLLSADESEEVMPILEDLFDEYNKSQADEDDDEEIDDITEVMD
jgi:Protein of unknown function (DUF3727)